MFGEFATYITRSKHDNSNEEMFCNFKDTMMKPSELRMLSEDSDYSSIKHLLSAVHRNVAGASGGERNHKSPKHVHSCLCARLGAAKVETGTAIHFNAKHLLLIRKMVTTRSSQFCKWWLQHLGSPFLAGCCWRQSCMPEPDDWRGERWQCLLMRNLTGGVDMIADEDILALADREKQQLNVFDGSTVKSLW